MNRVCDKTVCEVWQPMNEDCNRGLFRNRPMQLRVHEALEAHCEEERISTLALTAVEHSAIADGNRYTRSWEVVVQIHVQ